MDNKNRFIQIQGLFVNLNNVAWIEQVTTLEYDFYMLNDACLHIKFDSTMEAQASFADIMIS